MLPGVDAQVLYGTLLGTITDSSGSAIGGAQITATNGATGQTRTSVTDDRGFYAFRDLQPGQYKLEAVAPGFAKLERTSIAIAPNIDTRIDATLQLQDVSQSVVVSAATAALQTDRADVHTDLGAREIENLPLGGYRNYQSLLNLVPGATPTRFQNALMDTPGRSLTTNINGTSRTGINTRVDGATDVFPYLPHHTIYNPPAEDIETVNIATNSFNAEQGIAGGAAINVITKSGTNDIHGVLFEDHNDSDLAARNFFYLKNNRPKNILNQFGGTLGGPIKKNKLFYFLSYEGLMQRQDYSATTTVPTAMQRLGNFAGLSTIYDPASGNSNGQNRTPFAGNMIPIPAQNASALKMQSLVPLPNLPGAANNYFADATDIFDRHNADTKVNWNIDDKSSLFGKYSVMDATVQAPPILGSGGGTGLVSGGGSGNSHTLVQVAGIGYTRAFTPNLLFDANVGFARIGEYVTENDYGQNLGANYLGIPGTNGSSIQQSGLPSFAISGYETFGNPDSWTPEFRNDNVYTYVANLAWTKGAHTVRFGMDINHTAMNDYQPQRGYGPRGGFTFTGGVTALNGGAAPTQYNSYADFLLGSPISYGKSYQYLNPMSVREWQNGLYAQDQWQATRSLTLTMGVRWEYYPIIQRANRGIERYDLATNQVLLGCVASVPCDAGTSANPHQFVPRFGLAWRIDEKTVFRGGYGMSVDPYPFSRAMRDPYPVTVAQIFNSNNSYSAAGNLSSGIPQLTPINFGNGVIPLPLDAYTKTLQAGQYNRGYVESFNFTLERNMGAGFVLGAGYVGTRTIRQTVYAELNAGQVPGAGAAGQPLYTQFGRKAQTQGIIPCCTANYNSLQTSLKRSFKNGVMLTASYTYSKSQDYNSDSDSSFLFNIVAAQSRNRAVSDFDRTHVFQSGIVAELPFGKGKAWLNSGGFTNALVSGWQINGIFSAYTGTPFTVYASGASLNAPYNTQVADQVKPFVQILGGVGSSTWFDTSAFSAVTQARLGNSGRNSLRGPGTVNLDLSLFRSFKIRERMNLEARAEAFNISNTPHFSNPSSTIGSGSFGHITSTFGGAADSRVLRIDLRLSF
jgi:outer membrane receptor protein involved in Fe transport